MNIKVLHSDNSLAIKRAVGVKFVNNQDLPAVLINLAHSNGINLYNSHGFSKACGKVLEEHENILKDVRSIGFDTQKPNKAAAEESANNPCVYHNDTFSCAIIDGEEKCWAYACEYRNENVYSKLQNMSKLFHPWMIGKGKVMDSPIMDKNKEYYFWSHFI